jgi:hypothetical protein
MEQFIAHWKKEYRHIYTVELGEQQFVYRALTVEEINQIDDISGGSSVEMEDLYVQTAILYPQNFDINTVKAGYVTQLAEEVMRVSGLIDPDFINSALQEERETVSNLINMMKIFIISAMPTYNDEFLDTLTIRELISKTVLAEQILTLNQQIHGIATEGVKLELNSEEKQPSQKEIVDKESLLRRIRKNEKEFGSYDPDKLNNLEEFDPELLIRASGVPLPNDPIAKKLRQAMGG